MVLYRLGYRALRRSTPEWHNRRWSNAELRKVGHLFTGEVINVSGWRDEDREHAHYADYFPHKASYTVSNVGGAKGLQGADNEFTLDLERPVPEDRRRRYDVVFNHTTLEHVYDIHAAVKALCTLSRDVVIVVVPFAQGTHWEEGSYRDYWRPTPFALRNLFEARSEIGHIYPKNFVCHDRISFFLFRYPVVLMFMLWQSARGLEPTAIVYIVRNRNLLNCTRQAPQSCS